MSLLSSIRGRHWTDRLKQLLVVAITLGVLGVPLWALVAGDGATPIPWDGDWTPREQWVCDDSPMELDQVEDLDALWVAYGWPEWPAPVRVESCPSTPPAGVAMWRGCGAAECGRDGGLGGQTAHYYRRGEMSGVVIHTGSPWTIRSCVPLHESGHARGVYDREGPERHTSAATSIMAAECGSSMRLLDRTEGDWP